MTFTIADESDITIESTSPINIPFDISSPNVTTNSSQEFENNNTNINLVKDIRLQNLQLEITNPSNQTFSFLSSIHLYISTSSSDEIEIAFLDAIPSSATKIDLIPTNVKLDTYVKAPAYNLRTKVVTKQILTNDVNVKINTKFRVTANL